MNKYACINCGTSQHPIGKWEPGDCRKVCCVECNCVQVACYYAVHYADKEGENELKYETLMVTLPFSPSRYDDEPETDSLDVVRYILFNSCGAVRRACRKTLDFADKLEEIQNRK